MTNIMKHDLDSTYYSNLEFFQIRLCVRGSRRSERSIDSLKAGLHVAQVSFFCTISNFYWLFRTIFHFFRKRRLTLHFHCSVSSSTAFLQTRGTGEQTGDTSQFPRLTCKWVWESLNQGPWLGDIANMSTRIMHGGKRCAKARRGFAENFGLRRKFQVLTSAILLRY